MTLRKIFLYVQFNNKCTQSVCYLLVQIKNRHVCVIYVGELEDNFTRICAAREAEI